ncbi:MAG TPA: protein-L-isoaspartate(D-aspartate) O-methyltransferase [Candidatus Binatia bacterium]|nr:protein-L-isoaspartate(D-aspartate) O-methyltransferase [Candidatus Binatia bacterium]
MNTIILSLKPNHKPSALTTLVFFLLPLVLLNPPHAESGDRFVRARQAMIERDLVARGIRDERVLEAMGTIERELFVPEKLRAFAYEDRPLPIGEEQTISQPYMVAYMTELLRLKGAERVLEIGTGSGYQTAVLGKLAAEVYSIEIIPKLSERAKSLLDRLGFENIHLKVGDGFFGWEERSPFDAILVTAAAPKIPEPLWRQLREGGRLILPLGAEGQTQRLVRVTKSEGKQVVEELSGVVFVPLTGAIRQNRR